MIKKCAHLGCDKAGTCPCPKDRRLKDYWYFCQKHAAEYNKNWNYYAGMSADEINRQWEKDVFGERAERSPKAAAEYQKLIGDFLRGRAKIPARPAAAPTMDTKTAAAMKILGLPQKANWPEVQKKYRQLAKQEHPDTGKSENQSRFVEIGNAYHTLRKFFKR